LALTRELEKKDVHESKNECTALQSSYHYDYFDSIAAVQNYPQRKKTGRVISLSMSPLIQRHNKK
jgi:hypothetical protein